LLKIDIHTHTSEDCFDDVQYNAFQIIDKASAEEFDAIAITNHDRLTYSCELIEYAEKKDILLIPGMEATLSGKHILIINPGFRYNPPKRSIQDLEKLKKENNLIIAPHPFFPQSKSLKSLVFSFIELFDGIEFSHCYNSIINCNHKAVHLAEKYHLPLVGTSDCHFLWEFGKTFTWVDAKKNIRSIIDAIKEGKIHLHSTPLSAFHMVKIAGKFIQMKASQFKKKQIEY